MEKIDRLTKKINILLFSIRLAITIITGNKIIPESWIPDPMLTDNVDAINEVASTMNVARRAVLSNL